MALCERENIAQRTLFSGNLSVSSKMSVFLVQCGGVLVVGTFGHMPLVMAVCWHLVSIWWIIMVLAIFVSLSIVRMFLLMKVGKIILY